MVGQKEFMDVHDAWVQGKSISEIARQTGRDRKTIRRLLCEGAQTARKPRQISSKLDPFRQYLLARMVGEDPVSNAEVLYDEIRELGYRGGRSILKEFMQPLRALAKASTQGSFDRRRRMRSAPTHSRAVSQRGKTASGICDSAVIHRRRCMSREAGIVFRNWSGARDLNPGPHGPEPA
jgi:hypothetical protein